jgi:hypothetical protein
MDNNLPLHLEQELSSLRRELQVIDRWNRLFATTEINADSYVARQRRRWEIVIRVKLLEELSAKSRQDKRS